MHKKTKNATHVFPKPVTVLRYIPQKKEWNKAEYRALHSRLPQWEMTATIQNGCANDGHFFMQSNVYQGLTTILTDTLLLRGYDSATWIDMYQRGHKLPYFLNLRKTKAGELWVELCDDYYPNFGSRKRDRFDILPLLPGKSAAIHINAQYWHTLTGVGTDTHYVENYLYLEHLGCFDRVTLLEEMQVPFEFTPHQEVDLRHMMH